MLPRTATWAVIAVLVLNTPIKSNAQGILSIETVELETTEKDVNTGTAYVGGDGGLTITVTGASFLVPLPNTVKQTIVAGVVGDGQRDGFLAQKATLLQPTSITTTTTTLVIPWAASLDYDIDTDEWLNITIPDSALASSATVLSQPQSVRIQKSTGTIIIAKRPYDLPNGAATGHTMAEADARTDKPSIFIAVSPWENWAQDATTPLGINNMATNCTFSNRPTQPYGWDARVKVGNLIEWDQGRFAHPNGEHLKITTNPALTGWRYLEVFISPDSDYDTSITETISIDTSCVARYLGSGLEPNPDAKLSFDIEPTPGSFWVATNAGNEVWETDISVGAPCNWEGVSSTQVADPDPRCSYGSSVSNPSPAASATFPLVVTVNLEKGETWLRDATAQTELLDSFTSILGSDFVNHKSDILNVGNIQYIDDWTVAISLLSWPQWAASRRQTQSFDITVDEYIRLSISHRCVASKSTSLLPIANPVGSVKPPGFTIKPAPGWLVAEGNLESCAVITAMAGCVGGCTWTGTGCVSSTDSHRDLIFTEEEVRNGEAYIALMFGAAPGYTTAGVPTGDTVLQFPDASSTEAWCTQVLPTATITSTVNRCTKVIDGSDLRAAFTSGSTAPTYWDAREASLLPNSAVTVTPRSIIVNIPADPSYDIWDEEVVMVNIHPYSGTPPSVITVMTTSGLVPFGQPLNITIKPSHGGLKVQHATITHPLGSITFTEDQVRAGIGVLRMTWEGEMWRLGCCEGNLRAGGDNGELPPGGLRMMSDVTAVTNPDGWNNRLENSSDLLPFMQTVVTDIPAGATAYGRVLELRFQPDPYYDTSIEEHITISITESAVVSSLSYMGMGWPRASCTPGAGCSDFVINIEPSAGRLVCLGGASDTICPDLTEQDIRDGGRVITLRLDVGETWNAAVWPSPFKTDFIGLMHSIVTTSTEPSGFQARKGTIVVGSGLEIDFTNSSRELILTLQPDSLYDLVSSAEEEVRIEISSSMTSSAPLVTPSVVSFKIRRSAGTVTPSACLGVTQYSTSGNPSPTTNPVQPATAECATSNVASSFRLWSSLDNVEADTLVITERDIRLGDVSLRLALGCGETWSAIPNKEQLIKAAFANFPELDTLLPDASLATTITIPAGACPQVVTVMLQQHPDFDIAVPTDVKLELPGTLFVSGLTPPTVYLRIQPSAGRMSLNVKKGSIGTAGDFVGAGNGDNSYFTTDTSEGVIDEEVIREGRLVLNITFEAGETWAQTTQCRDWLVGSFAGAVNPNQQGEDGVWSAYQDPNAWGPGKDSVHTTALPSSAVVQFQGTKTALVRLAAVPNYDISVPQNVTLDVPPECTMSALRPWWDDVARNTAPYASVTMTMSADVNSRLAAGDPYTHAFRDPAMAGGIPGNGFFTIVPTAGSLRLTATDGRGCSGACETYSTQNPIMISDDEARSGVTTKLRLELVGERWAVDSDAEAGATCVPASGWCNTPSRRTDVCTDATTCSCSGTPSDCCALNPSCDGSAPSPQPTNFNFKSLVWYFTYVFGEDWPKSPATGAGTIAASAAALIASTANADTGFTGRKDTLFPAPEVFPTATSVTLVSPTIIEISFAVDTGYSLTTDETVVITLPDGMTRSGLQTSPPMVNFSFVVTPPVVTMGPKNTFTETEIRAGVTLTFTLNMGCWVTGAENLLLQNMRSDRTAVQQPNGWEMMIRDRLFAGGVSMTLPVGTCTQTIEIPLNATNGVADPGEAYDTSQIETITIGLSSTMTGSSVTPVGNPSPLVFTITPDAGSVEIYPPVLFERDIKVCTTPLEIVVRLTGERWATPYNSVLQSCIVNAMDSITLNSEFDRLKSTLVIPSAVTIRNPWEAVVPIQCTPGYNSDDPEIVFVQIVGACVASGIPPGPAVGPAPPRFQIQMEQASSVGLMEKNLQEADFQSGSPCVTIILVGTMGYNDTFVDDSVKIVADMVSNKFGAGWDKGFNARKTSLVAPSGISIIHQGNAPLPGDVNRPKLLICFNTDPEYQIDEPEVVTITIHGTAISTGIAPNYLDNEPLQVTISPSRGNLTIFPDTFTEDEIRNGGAVITMLLDYSERWGANPGACATGGTGGDCTTAIPTRYLCECNNSMACEANAFSTATQPFGWNQRFNTIVSAANFGFTSSDPIRSLELTLTADVLFDVTQDQYVRVEMPGCATASGVPTLVEYIKIIQTPGKISLAQQVPAVGSSTPCGDPCYHGTPLSFTERDVRNGSISLLLRVDGDQWLNRPAHVQAGFVSDCPETPLPGVPTVFCPDGFNAKLADIVPTSSILKVINSDSRLLQVNFTTVPTYNIDSDELVCVTFPASVMASGLAPEMSADHQQSYGSAFCFNITAVPGTVSVVQSPEPICESHIRLGTSSFTLQLEEEFWNLQAPLLLFSYITGNQTCLPSDTACLAKYNQNSVFVGQKARIIPTVGGILDTSKVVFLDGPPPYHTQLHFPFPDVSMLSLLRPWYDIEETEMISIDVIAQSTASGLRPLEPNPATFEIQASTLSVSDVMFWEDDLRNATVLKFNLTLYCDEWVPGSEVIMARAFTAERQPAPNNGWDGRKGTILRLDVINTPPTVLQVSLLTDPVYDICSAFEDIAIDFSIHASHFSEAEMQSMFASGVPPTPYVDGRRTKYKTLLTPADDASDFMKFRVQSKPGQATMITYKNNVQCPSPCTFTEDEIRDGVGSIRLFLTGSPAGWSNAPSLVLGLNSSLSAPGSFSDRVCTIAPKSSVTPQVSGGTTAVIPFDPDAMYDIVEDEWVWLSLPEGNVYDPCTMTTVPSSSLCDVDVVGDFRLKVQGSPGAAQNCSCDTGGCMLPAGLQSLEIYGMELDASPNMDAAFAMPAARDCSQGDAFGYGVVTDFPDTDARGLTRVKWEPDMYASGQFNLCYKNKGSAQYYKVPLCGALDIVGAVWSATTPDGTLGPFKLGTNYNVTFKGKGLNSRPGTDQIKTVPDGGTCDKPGDVMDNLGPGDKSNVGPAPSSGVLDMDVATLQATHWDASFEKSGLFRLCYLPNRGTQWTDLGTFAVSGLVTDFTPTFMWAGEDTSVVVQGQGLSHYDRVFGVWNESGVFDTEHDCARYFPGDTLQVFDFPRLQAFDEYEVRGGVTVTALLDDKAVLDVKKGDFFKPGYYHLCYGFMNSSSWDTIPDSTLRVMTSYTRHSPWETEVLPPGGGPDTVFTLVGWGLDVVPSTLKLVKKGQSCTAGAVGAIKTVGTLRSGPDVGMEPRWNGFQYEVDVTASFTVPGTYYWCFQTPEMYNCNPPNTIPYTSCPIDSTVTTTGWKTVPQPLVVSPRFTGFWDQFIPAGSMSTVTATSAANDIDLGILSRAINVKLDWFNVSCTQSDPRDGAVSATVKEAGIRTTISFDITIARSGWYIICLGDHRVVKGGLLGVYPVPLGYDPVDIELRSEKVNPTGLLPGSAEPIPVTMIGMGLTGEGYDQYGKWRESDLYGAVPWGVESPEGGFYSCGNYSDFDLPAFGDPWWKTSNPHALRIDGVPATLVAEGTQTTATRLAWMNSTFTPGNYTLCLYDWVRGMWVDADPDTFYVPPNSAPELNLLNTDFIVHPNAGTISVPNFLQSNKAGLYAAEEAAQSVTYSVSPFNADTNAAFLTLPSYARGTNIMWFTLQQNALPGTYSFNITAKDNGGTLYGGEDTRLAWFRVQVKGVVSGVVQPWRFNVKENAKVTLTGIGLSTFNGDCARIVADTDPVGCNRVSEIPDKYTLRCPSGIPNCYTPEDQSRILQLQDAWRAGYTEGPYILPEVVPPQYRPDPSLPPGFDTLKEQLQAAWREGKYTASVHDVCQLEPGFFDNLNETFFTTPVIPFPGDYAVCYKLKGDTDRWMRVANSSFTVTGVVESYTPHAMYAGDPVLVNFTGGGLADVDQVVAVWLTDGALTPSVFDSYDCNDLSLNSFTNTPGGSSPSTAITGFSYPSLAGNTARIGINYTTVSIGEDVLRRTGHYRLCYKVVGTAWWLDVEGGMLRVFASIRSFEPQEQLLVGDTAVVNFTAIEIGQSPSNTTATMKVVKANCAGRFPNCDVNCNTSPQVLPPKTVGNVIPTTHPSGDSSSRIIQEPMNFNTAGYYYACWTTEEIRTCTPTGITNPQTCVYSQPSHPWRLVPDPIIVSPRYTGFTSFVSEAGDTTTIRITGNGISVNDMGPPGLALRTSIYNWTSCRQMGTPAVQQDTDLVYVGSPTITTSNEVVFDAVMTRGGDYDVCVGLTRVGDFTGQTWDTFRQINTLNMNLPPRAECPLWTETVKSNLSEVFCSNTSHWLNNTAHRVQPRVTMYTIQPEDAHYGSSVNIAIEGLGLAEQDSVFVINGTDGSTCGAWDSLPQWSKFGASLLVAPFMQQRNAGSASLPAAENITLPSGLPQPFSITNANWIFAFPRPGEFRLCYRSSVFGWSRVINPTLTINPPNVTDWDWIVVSESPVQVALQFYGTGLNSMGNGDRLMIVRDDQSVGDPCTRDPSDFSVAAYVTNLGPSNMVGANMTQHIWGDPDLNSFAAVRNYTMCYIPCWPDNVATTCGEPIKVGALQTPIRNFKPELRLTGDYLYSRPCAEVSIFSVPVNPGREQENWVSRSMTHVQNVSVEITYEEPLQNESTPNTNPDCGSCFFEEPYLSSNTTLRHFFQRLGVYTVFVKATDTGGTALGGINETETKMFKLEVTGENTPPVFETVPEVTVMVSQNGGTITGGPVVVGNVSGGSMEWEQRSQVVYFDVMPVSGVLDPYLSAKPVYNQQTNELTLVFKQGDRTDPVSLDLVFVGYDDLQAGVNGATLCGNSVTRKIVKLNINPPNQPPIFNWIGNTTFLAYEQLPYAVRRAIPAVGPSYEVPTQSLKQPIVTVLTNTHFFEILPNFTADGNLTFKIANNTIQDPPESATVMITIRDDGGVGQGGQDSASLRLEIFVVEYYSLVVSPSSIQQGSTATFELFGGMSEFATKLFYLWANSSGSMDVMTFSELRNTSDVVLLSKPSKGMQKTYSNLPVGSHTIFTLLFVDGSVDWVSFERFGANLCPSPRSIGLTYNGPCFLADTITVVSSPTPENDLTALIDMLSKQAPDTPATTIFALSSMIGYQMAVSSNSSVAPSQRATVANGILAAVRRLPQDNALLPDDLGNGIMAVKGLLLPVPGEDSVELTAGPTQAVVTALDGLAKENKKLWSACCGVALPAGCSTHDRSFCPTSCCGTATSNGEMMRISNGLLSTLGLIIANTTAAVVPNPWRSESEVKAGQSDSAANARKSDAVLMTNLLNTLHGVGESVCQVMYEDSLIANLTDPPLVDKAPYMLETVSFTVHLTAMHTEATTPVNDDFTVSVDSQDVEASISKAGATNELQHHSCRAFMAFGEKLLFRGNGDPKFTPIVPYFALKITPIGGASAVGTNTMKVSVTLPGPAIMPGQQDMLRWDEALSLWVHQGTASRLLNNRIKIEDTRQFVTYTTAMRTAATLQTSTGIQGFLLGSSLYDKSNKMCFACTALPVFFVLFIVAYVLASVVDASDKKLYQSNLGEEAVTHGTGLLELNSYVHMWLAPTARLPITLGYYSRVNRVKTLFTFFMMALWSVGLLYDNVSIGYSWEVSIDGGKAVYTGLVVAIMATVVSLIVCYLFFPGTRTPRMYEKSSRAVVLPEDDETTKDEEFAPLKAVQIPALPSTSRNRLATCLMLLIFIIGSIAMFFMTSNYSSKVQGEQYMLSFFFACLFHMGLEVIRSLAVHKSGAMEGGRYFEEPPETHEDDDIVEMHENTKDVEMYEDLGSQYGSPSRVSYGGAQSTTPVYQPQQPPQQHYNPDASPSPMFKSTTQSILNTGGSVPREFHSSRRPSVSPAGSVMASFGRARSLGKQPEPPSDFSQASIAAINHRGLGRGRTSNPIANVSPDAAEESHFSPTTVPIRGTGRGRGRSSTPPLLSGGAEPPTTIFTQFSSRGY